ncbi:MAG: hypothetical protein P1U58_06235 [Verrucomicrobiales bacterium]|nr:hypothetical protein [Verrucomicrobiales bacterium]
MTDFFPLLLAVLIVLLTFSSAMKNGVVKLIASGMAAFVLFVVLILGVQFLPQLAQKFLGLELTWKSNLGMACVLAILAYTISRIIFGWFFRMLLGPDSWFHWMSDGIPGGFLSVVPSLIIVIFLFTCTRIAGTVLELNYVATLCQPQVSHTNTKLPAYPQAARWRNTIESSPLIAGFFDLIDPFSTRASRNTGILVMVDRSVSLKAYFETLPETAALIEAPGLSQLSANEEVLKALQKQERLSFVNHPRIKDFASSFPDQPELKQLNLQPVLEGFVESVKPVPIPETSAAN